MRYINLRFTYLLTYLFTYCSGMRPNMHRTAYLGQVYMTDDLTNIHIGICFELIGTVYRSCSDDVVLRGSTKEGSTNEQLQSDDETIVIRLRR